MSHFCTLVLVHKDCESYEAVVDTLLKPYSENLKVDSYEKKCYCVGRIARKESAMRVDSEIGTLDDNERKKYVEMLDNKRHELAGGKEKFESLSNKEKDRIVIQAEKELDGTWKELISERFRLEEEYSKSHPLFDKPDQKCEECNGTGFYSSTYNPLSKWDWYSIGGRWSGALKAGYDPAADPRNQERCFLCNGTGKRDDDLGKQTRKNNPEYTCNGCGGSGLRTMWPTQWVDCGGNIEPVSSIPEDFAVYALVTPEGEWHERGEMGWFGISSNEKDKDEWKSFCKEIFKKYRDTHVAVVVDCHT